MYALRTRADLVFHWVLYGLVCALGALMLAFPLPSAPNDLAAYEMVQGTLQSLTNRSGRKVHRLEFGLQGNPRVFEIDRLPYEEAVASWTVAQSRMSFRVLPADLRTESVQTPIRVFGLVVDGRVWRTPEEDIAEAQVLASPLAGLFALGLGVSGMVVSGLVWRRRSPASAPLSPQASSGRPAGRGGLLLGLGALCLVAALGLAVFYLLLYAPALGQFNEEGRYLDGVTGVVLHDHGGMLAASAVLLALLGALALGWGWARRRLRLHKHPRPPG